MRTERIYTNKETGVSYNIIIRLDTESSSESFRWLVDCYKRPKGKRKWQAMHEDRYTGSCWRGVTIEGREDAIKRIICAEVPWKEIYECQKQILLELQKPCVTVPIKIGQDD